jgi:hypothetical protein
MQCESWHVIRDGSCFRGVITLANGERIRSVAFGAYQFAKCWAKACKRHLNGVEYDRAIYEIDR